MAVKQYHTPPTVDRSAFVNLMPEFTSRSELRPTTPVLCINRGPHWIRDQYDARAYDIPPFAKFEITYAAAVHLQRRAIVPGTKNPDPNDPLLPQYLSWIAILGVDPDEMCEVFSDADLQRFGESTEGLNRGAMPAADREVVTVRTADLRRQLVGTGVAPSGAAMAASAGGVAFPQQSLEGGSDEAREAALAPVVESDARRDAAAAIGKGWVPPPEGTIEDRSAAPPAPAIGRRRMGGR